MVIRFKLKSFHIILLTTFICTAYWFADGALHAVLFNKTFSESIYSPEKHELYNRIIIILTLFACGAAIQYSLNGQRQAKRIIKEQKQRLELAMDAADHAFWDWNMDTSETYFSPRYYTMLGYEPNELPMNFTTWINLLHPDDRKNVLPKIKKYIESTKPFEFEFRLKTKSGEWKWIRGKGTVCFIDKSNKTKRVIGTHEDISAAKKAKDELQKNKKQLESTIYAGELGTWDWNIKSGEVIFNEQWSKMLGYKHSEINSHFSSWEKLIHPEDAKMAKRVLQDHIDGKTPSYKTQHRLLSKTGKWIWILDCGKIVEYDDNGKPTRLMGVHIDITKRKETEEKIQKNESFLQAILNSIQDGLSILDPDLNILFTNPVMEKWYSDTMPIVGKKCYQCYHNSNKPCNPCPSLRCLNSQKTEFEIVPGFPDSDVKWIELYSYPIKNISTGKNIGVAEFVRDITNRKIAEDSLQENERKYRSLFTQASDLVMVYDPTTGKILEANEQTANILGYSISQIQQMSLAEIDAAGEASDSLYKNSIGNNDYHTFETTFRCKNDELLDMSVVKSKIYDNTNNFILITCRDISERKKEEKLRKKLIEELETKNSELERFTYTVSHDLKSPLVTIDGFTKIIKENISNKNYSQLDMFSSRIINAVETMQKLLNDLLNLSRIGRKVNPPEKVDIQELINSLIELLEGYISKQGVNIIIPSFLPIVYADKQRLLEVFMNLMENALKFTGNQKDPEIEIGYKHLKNEHLFFIKDNGVGIEKQYTEKIFSLFEKLDSSSEGTGVGLALVKRIIEFHNGKIWVESEGLNKGTTFYFTLPEKKFNKHKN